MLENLRILLMHDGTDRADCIAFCILGHNIFGKFYTNSAVVDEIVV